MSRCFLITGSSAGIGKALTKHLLKSGHDVIGISRRKQVEDSPKFTHYQIDLADLKSLPEKFKQIDKDHPEIDFVILNAGYGEINNIEDMSYESIEQLISFNVTQYAFLTKALLPSLKKKEHANLVYVSSKSGHKGSKRFSTYCASKFALKGFAESIRDECRPTGVHVTIFSPGMVRTDFFEKLDVGASDHPYEAIDSSDFNHLIDLLIHLRKGTVIEEIVLGAQRTGSKSKT